jgi:hypothetical protein
MNAELERIWEEAVVAYTDTHTDTQTDGRGL